MVTAARFLGERLRLWSGWRRALCRGDCAPAAPGKTPRLAKLENTNVVNAWAVSLLKEGGTRIGVLEQHGRHATAYAGGAREGMCRMAGLGVKLVHWGSGPVPVGTRSDDAQLATGRFDGLMAQMADRACVGGRIDMMMPDLSQRRPDQEREKRYREYQAPDSLLIRHF